MAAVAFQLGVFEQRLSGGRPRAQNAADDELESQNSDHGLVMGPLQNQVPLFFRDGKRRIDYVLVYEDNEGARLGKHDEWRSTFMANLRQAGLDMEEVSAEAAAQTYCAAFLILRLIQVTRLDMLCSFHIRLCRMRAISEEDATFNSVGKVE
ncbi:hypothetical protein HPB51_009286 [Rhipicephalus microplus]|uniref:Anoctamin dimerisation domain-containing protein n=1 Tax=Rhipicephalus microplus TaxID=6941 RepID=A0A9J6EZT3_RHIMP|nr:hypothetical protein HPB51_009286 [Rhipicephalus microplus]